MEESRAVTTTFEESGSSIMRICSSRVSLAAIVISCTILREGIV